jgi:hypothetical protein
MSHAKHFSVASFTPHVGHRENLPVADDRKAFAVARSTSFFASSFLAGSASNHSGYLL